MPNSLLPNSLIRFIRIGCKFLFVGLILSAELARAQIIVQATVGLQPAFAELVQRQVEIFQDYQVVPVGKSINITIRLTGDQMRPLANQLVRAEINQAELLTRTDRQGRARFRLAGTPGTQTRVIISALYPARPIHLGHAELWTAPTLKSSGLGDTFSRDLLKGGDEEGAFLVSRDSTARHWQSFLAHQFAPSRRWN